MICGYNVRCLLIYRGGVRGGGVVLRHWLPHDIVIILGFVVLLALTQLEFYVRPVGTFVSVPQGEVVEGPLYLAELGLNISPVGALIELP